MSPTDKVERVLKEIHIMFSKCESVDRDPGKIMVDRKQFLGLLDRLNQGIYDMMEQYEQTRQSRDHAERAFKKRGEEIIEDANRQAEDVYAASVIYTADMLGRIRDLMDQTNESMNDLFREFRKNLREQKDLVKTHETELQGQLADMVDTRKYVSIIENINHERDRKNRDLKAEKEAGVQYAKNMVYTPPSAADVKVNTLYFEKAGKAVPEQNPAAPVPAEKPDIRVNKDAAYFKWKESQGGEKNPAEPYETAEVLVQTAEDACEPKQEFPSEEEIMRAVMEDELAMEREKDAEMEKQSAGSILKNLIFGK